jgi:hypothetical protein
MYDNPMYRYSRDGHGGGDMDAQAGKAAAATAPQWNQYYTGPGSGQRYKESVDGDVEVVDIAAMVGQGFSFGGSFMSLTPSPMRVRSFLDHNALASYGSPAGLAKQLDSMKTYLSHYPAPSDAPAPSLPTM